MPTGPAFQKKISDVIRRVASTTRVVKLRQVTESGGNNAIGLGGVTTFFEQVMDPQPVVEMVDVRAATRLNMTDALQNVSDGMTGLARLGDYILTVDGAVSEDLLNRSQVIYGTEVLRIIGITPYPFDNTIIAWSVVCRAVAEGQ